MSVWNYVGDWCCIRDMRSPSLGGNHAYLIFHGRWRTVTYNIWGKSKWILLLWLWHWYRSSWSRCSEHHSPFIKTKKNCDHYQLHVLLIGVFNENKMAVFTIVIVREYELMGLKWRNPDRYQRIANFCKMTYTRTSTFLENYQSPESVLVCKTKVVRS